MTQPIREQPVLAIDRKNEFFHVESAESLVAHRVWDSSFTFYDGRGQVLRITRKAGGGKVLRPDLIACDPVIPLQRLNSAVAHLARHLECHEETPKDRETASRLRAITGDLPTKLEALQNFDEEEPDTKPQPWGNDLRHDPINLGHRGNGLHNTIHRVFG